MLRNNKQLKRVFSFLLILLITLMSACTGGDDAPTGQPPVAQQLVGITGHSQSPQFVEVNAVNGDLSLISGMGLQGYAGLSSLTYAENGNQYYALDTVSEQLVSINAGTSEVTAISPLGGDSGFKLAYNSNENIIYTVSRNGTEFRKINPVNMDVTAVSVQNVGVFISAIAYDSNTQILYAHTRESANLLTIDTTTGESQLLGYSGIRWVYGMAFDTDQNILYAINFDKKLFRINTTTGEASEVSSIRDSANSLTYNTLSNELVAYVSPNREYVSVDPTIPDAFVSGNSVSPKAAAYNSTADSLIISDAFNHDIITVDSSTGAVTNRVHSPDRDRLSGLAYNADGTVLYGVTSSNELVRIDVATGVKASIGWVRMTGLSGDLYGLTFDPATNRLYSAASVNNVNYIIEIDPADVTSFSVAVVTMSNPTGFPIRGVAMVGGSLYGFSGISNPDLISIDISGVAATDGAGTLVAAIAGVPNVFSMVYNSGLAQLVGFSRDASGQVYVNNINMMTAETTPIGVMFHGRLSAMAYNYNQASQVLYGVDAIDSAMITINPATGLFTPLSTTNGVNFSGVTGMAVNANSGLIYIADVDSGTGASVLDGIAPDTGIRTNFGSLMDGASNVSNMRLSYDSGNNILYGVSAAQLYNINLTAGGVGPTGTSTPIGAGLGGGITELSDIAFDHDTNTLYGFIAATGSVFEINTTTGEAGAMSSYADLIDVAAIAFSETDSSLYGSSVSGFYRVPLAGAQLYADSLKAFSESYREVEAMTYDTVSETLYGFDNTSQRLLRIDPSTGRGAGLTKLTPADLELYRVSAMAYDSSGPTLYAVILTNGSDTNRSLVRINPSNGLVTVVGVIEVSPGNDIQIEGMTFNSDTGVLYGVSSNDSNGNNNLYSISTTDAVATMIGSVGALQTPNSTYIGGLAYDSDSSTLYGTSASAFQHMSTLYSIDMVTGVASLIVQMDRESYESLAYIGEPNTLYGVPKEDLSKHGDNGLFRFQTDSGKSTAVGFLGYSRVVSIANDADNQVLYGVTNEAIYPGTGMELFGRLFSIDENGQGSFIAYTVTNVEAVAYNNDTMTLYGYLWNQNQLISIDPSDGTHTVVGATTVQFASLAYDNDTQTLYGYSMSPDGLHIINTSDASHTLIPGTDDRQMRSLEAIYYNPNDKGFYGVARDDVGGSDLLQIDLDTPAQIPLASSPAILRDLVFK